MPLVAIGLAAAGISIGSTVHSTLKVRKWKKIHDEALEKCRETEASVKATANGFNRQAKQFGEFRVNYLEGLKEAAEFLQKAKVKHREFEELNASIPDVTILHWQDLHQATLKSVGRGTAGIAGAAGAATVTVAGRIAFLVPDVHRGGHLRGRLNGSAHSGPHRRRRPQRQTRLVGRWSASAGGAGMAGGLSALALSANVVALPIGIGAAAWGQWKASQLKGKVELALKDFARAEVRMREQAAVMTVGGKRIDELEESILNARSSLTGQLQVSDEDNIEDLHRVDKLAHTLAELLEQPALTPEQQRVLQA